MPRTGKELSIKAVNTNGTLVIQIDGDIYEYYNGSRQLKRALREMESSDQKDLHFYIKTNGGDVFEGNEMCNLVKAYKKKHNCKAYAKCGAIVASAGTYFLKVMDEVDVPANIQGMIHKPHGGTYGNEDDWESNLKLLKNITADYVKSYAVMFKKTEDEIRTMLQKDYWMNATEMVDIGLATRIIDDEVIDEETQAMLKACNAPQILAIGTKQSLGDTATDENSDFMKIDYKALGLPKDATEEQVNARIAALANAEKNAKNLVAAAQKREAEAAEAKVMQVINAALATKQIQADEVDEFKALLALDFDTTKSIIDKRPKLKALSTGVKPVGVDLGDEESGIDASRKDWDYAKWAENDPEGFAALMGSHPDEAERLIAAYYK